MSPGVTGQIDELHRSLGYRPHGGLGLLGGAGHGDHAAVVVTVGVDVEEEPPGLLRHLGDHLPVPALAHVEHALEHGLAGGFHAAAGGFIQAKPGSRLMVIQPSSRLAGRAGYLRRG